MRHTLAGIVLLFATALQAHAQGALPPLPKDLPPPVINRPAPPPEPLDPIPPFAPPGLKPTPQTLPMPMTLPGVPRPIPEPPPPITIMPQNDSNVVNAAPTVNFEPVDTFSTFRTWGGMDYSMWWFSKTPIAVPLAVSTTSAPGSPGVNILGVDPNAHVVLGANSLAQDPSNGGRLWLGFWFDDHRRLGVEIAGLWAETPTQQVGVQSNVRGVPMYSRPVVIPGLGASVYDISYPTFVSGKFAIETQQLLQGVEANFVGFAVGNQNLFFDILAGGRFLNLEERINLNYQMTNLVPLPAFGNELLAAGTTAYASDLYRTRNQFYGGQIGGRLESNFGRLSVSMAGKIAFGVNDMSLDIEGSTTRSDRATVYPAGILANGANMGRYRESHFAFVPEANLSVGWWFTQNLRLKVGYNVLYISEVVRPGSNITNMVNPSAVPVDQLYGTSPVARSPSLFQRTDFWAEGLTFGIDFRY
ncbi:MAG: BBP7 family outer membrane beta-barrel protein [Planctomycetota bacterium]